MIQKYFYLTPSHSCPDKYIIALDFDKFPYMTTSGSYNLLFARLMNLPYGQYLRFCRDCAGATLIGKNQLYPIALFDNNRKANRLVEILNGRMSLVMWEIEHPDWKEHQQVVEEHKAKMNALHEKLKEKEKEIKIW